MIGPTGLERIGLVSCVKSKTVNRAPACDLYTSPLFVGARSAVEASCNRWFVLSAKHHLVRPDTVLAPYEQTLTTARVGERRAWSERVLGQLILELGDLTAFVFEIHAGRAYYAHGLLEGLQRGNARVEIPVEGLSLGQRLQHYSRASGSAASEARTSNPTVRRGRRSTYRPLTEHLASLKSDRWEVSFADRQSPVEWWK